MRYCAFYFTSRFFRFDSMNVPQADSFRKEEGGDFEHLRRT